MMSETHKKYFPKEKCRQLIFYMMEARSDRLGFASSFSIRHSILQRKTIMKKMITAMALVATVAVPGQAAAAEKLGMTPVCRNVFDYAQREGNEFGYYFSLLVRSNCQAMYSKGWLQGSGTDSSACNSIWSKLEQMKLTYGQYSGKPGTTLVSAAVTYNCPQMYSAGWVKY
jgi:hypothetical protein